MKQNWKGKVKAAAYRESKNTDGLSRAQRYRRIYNKKKFWRPKTEPHMEAFRYLPKMIIDVELSLAALAVYPVLCCAANFEENNWFQISEENIARQTGLSLTTVRKAIEELADMHPLKIKTKAGKNTQPLLEREKRQEGQVRYWMYRVYFFRTNMIGEETKGQYFFFYNHIIELGLWKILTPRAKALYLGMRVNAKFDFWIYCDVEGYRTYECNRDKLYTQRKWDICKESPTKLCTLIGINKTHISQEIELLEAAGLIERCRNGTYIVYLKYENRHDGENSTI